MKFAQYLRDTQTPEWKKAYIDYRGLKKFIRRAVSNDENQTVQSPTQSIHDELEQSTAPQPRGHELYDPSHGLDNARSPSQNRPSILRTESDKQEDADRTSDHTRSSRGRPETRPTFVRKRGASFSSNRGRKGLHRAKSISLRKGTRATLSHPYAEPPTLQALLPQLTRTEKLFFEKLDAELEKTESFYLDREKEMSSRTRALEQQLRELQDHRKIFHEANPIRTGWTSALKPKLNVDLKARFPGSHKRNSKSKSPTPELTTTDAPGTIDTLAAKQDPAVPPHLLEAKMPSLEKTEKANGHYESFEEGTSPRDLENVAHSLSPEDYLNAKKKLKKAVIEHYRVLEMLHNYRVLNVTGFRKALKKFEKVTRIPAQQAYMNEKVDPSAIGSSKSINSMMADMHDLYATCFTKGDRKRAMDALRPGAKYKSHHFSTYRSGMLIGIAVPAFVSGLVNSFRPEVRSHIGAWDALLFVYGILFVPVLLSMLIGLNILVYARTRINYLFIFELDIKTRLDYREYFEIPSILFAALCYAFWLSFADIHSVPAKIWPLVWLGFTAVMVFDPLPLFFKPSRYWLLHASGKLLLSGFRRVEFADFWLGDQLTSLVFTFSNLYLIPCVYATGFNSNWKKCGTASTNWPVIFVLAALPFLMRALQSVKRYADTRLYTHLINGGKYLSGLIAYLLYFMWRHQGQKKTGAVFALWCILNTLYSLYAMSWDFLMDWSLLQPHARWWMLRDELVFKDHVWLYYLAIISNAVLRFAWIMYIPTRPADTYLITFIAGLVEIIRRFQWNFYRLENEHLGNVDQYRVSKEVPLPYSFDQPSGNDTGEDDDDDDVHPTQ